MNPFQSLFSLNEKINPSIFLHFHTEKNGLAVGDEILEVNNINFEEIAISSAIRVLQGSKRLRMTVQHNPALAQHSQRRQSKEKTKW